MLACVAVWLWLTRLQDPGRKVSVALRCAARLKCLLQAVLDGRQLALKISANSVYGFTGAPVLRCAAVLVPTAVQAPLWASCRVWRSAPPSRRLVRASPFAQRLRSC